MNLCCSGLLLLHLPPLGRETWLLCPQPFSCCVTLRLHPHFSVNMAYSAEAMWSVMAYIVTLYPCKREASTVLTLTIL